MQVEEVLALIRELAAPGRVVIVATHDERFTPIADRVIDLTPPQAEEVGARRVTLEQGELLFEQGDPSDLIYVIEEGAVETFRRRADGSIESIAILSPGDYVGELGPLLSLPRSASVRATAQTVARGYDVREFSRLTRRRRREREPAER